MKHFYWIIKLSRPRFWGYLAGPFIIGVVAFADSLLPFLSWEFWAWLGYFLVLGNILLYGVNDLADNDTDELNAKKKGYEEVLAKQKKKTLKFIIIFCGVVGVLLSIISGKIGVVLTFLAWLGLSLAYSLPPLRFKALPFVDFASNVLYVIPGILGFVLFSPDSSVFIPTSTLLAAWAWAGAMHCYSAIPDIIPDQKAKLKTTAVVLGENLSAALVAVLFTISGVLAYDVLGWLSIAFLAVYLLLVGLSFRFGFFRIYKVFPIINFLVGIILFWKYFYPLAITSPYFPSFLVF